MTEANEVPSVWRLLWSPRAMAWWARYRPVASVRMGIAALAVGLDTFIVAAVGDINESLVELLGWFLVRMGLYLACIVLFTNGWSWTLKRRMNKGRKTQQNSVVVISSLPGMLIIAVDGMLTVYREALNNGSFNSANLFWPPLPEWLEQAPQTYLWVLSGFGLWLIYGVMAGHHFAKLPPVESGMNCPQCHYDLRGTRAAGIGRCPECGAALEAVVGDEASNPEK